MIWQLLYLLDNIFIIFVNRIPYRSLFFIAKNHSFNRGKPCIPTIFALAQRANTRVTLVRWPVTVVLTLMAGGLQFLGLGFSGRGDGRACFIGVFEVRGAGCGISGGRKKCTDRYRFWGGRGPGDGGGNRICFNRKERKDHKETEKKGFELRATVFHGERDGWGGEEGGLKGRLATRGTGGAKVIGWGIKGQE
jgi:hypothetical protein